MCGSILKVTDPLYLSNSVSLSIWVSTNKFTGYLKVLLVFNGKCLSHWFINGVTHSGTSSEDTITR